MKKITIIGLISILPAVMAFSSDGVETQVMDGSAASAHADYLTLTLLQAEDPSNRFGRTHFELLSTKGVCMEYKESFPAGAMMPDGKTIILDPTEEVTVIFERENSAACREKNFKLPAKLKYEKFATAGKTVTLEEYTKKGVALKVSIGGRSNMFKHGEMSQEDLIIEYHVGEEHNLDTDQYMYPVKK